MEDRHCSLESDKTGSRALKQKLITLVRRRRKTKVSSFYQILLFMGFLIISAKIPLLEFRVFSIPQSLSSLEMVQNTL